MNASRVSEIDLFRFVAAMAVVFFHYAFRGYAADQMTVMPPAPALASIAKYGYLGVDFFFMISGFVIMMTAAAGNLKSFVISRLVRLYPAFWFCCTLTFAVLWFAGKPRFEPTIAQYLANMTMLYQLFGVPAIDGSYWSLVVELKFYALVAAVLIFGKINHAERLAVAWLALTIVVEIFPLPPLNSIFITPHSALFIAGMLFFFVWSRGVSLLRLAGLAMCAAVASAQGLRTAAELQAKYNTRFEPWIVLAIILGLFIIMGGVALKRSGWLGKKNWTALGVLTYPVYLIHQNVGYVVFNHLYPAVNSHVLLWGMVAVSLMLAYLVHRYIEARFSAQFKTALNNLTARMGRLLQAGGHTQV